MTSWIHVTIKGKKIMAKAGGYTGKKEAKTPKGDVVTANRIWISKEQKQKLGLRYGQKVIIKVGRTRKSGIVKRWSRNSAQIIFTKPGLPRYVKVYPKYNPRR